MSGSADEYEGVAGPPRPQGQQILKFPQLGKRGSAARDAPPAAERAKPAAAAAGRDGRGAMRRPTGRPNYKEDSDSESRSGSEGSPSPAPARVRGTRRPTQAGPAVASGHRPQRAAAALATAKNACLLEDEIGWVLSVLLFGLAKLLSMLSITRVLAS